MQNYEQILEELGIEVPEDKKSELEKKMNENYRTKTDYDKVVKKRDEYKQSLDDVQEEIDKFKDVDVDDLKTQITTLTTQLREEKEGREADALKVQREEVISEFLKDKKFVNQITEKSIRDSIMVELEKNTGKSVDMIFESLTKDAEGKLIPNILVDEQLEQLENDRPRFTEPIKNAPQPGRKMSPAELMKLKNANPNLDIRQYM